MPLIKVEPLLKVTQKLVYQLQSVNIYKSTKQHKGLRRIFWSSKFKITNDYKKFFLKKKNFNLILKKKENFNQNKLLKKNRKLFLIKDTHKLKKIFKIYYGTNIEPARSYQDLRFRRLGRRIHWSYFDAEY